jgi:MFS family permease
MDRRYLVLGGLGLAMVFCATYPFISAVPLLIVLGATEALGFAAALPSLQSLLTQGSDPSEVGRIQGLFGTTQTACTAVSAAAAGAAFALARWLPFVTAAAITFMALVATAIVWRTVAGHVHPEQIATDSSEGFVEQSTEADHIIESTEIARAGQPAVGVSVEVQ